MGNAFRLTHSTLSSSPRGLEELPLKFDHSGGTSAAAKPLIFKDFQVLMDAHFGGEDGRR